MSTQPQITCTPPKREEDRRALEAAMEAGHILLENGAEIARVEETMHRISRAYGVEDSSFFVLSNGIFTTGSSQFARVRHIPVHGSRMDKVVAVNQLSREIESGKHTLEEAGQRLAEIRNLPDKKPILQILASGVGSACFCVLFGGGPSDAAAAMLAGLLLYVLILFVFPKRMSKLLANILGGLAVAVVCMLLNRIGIGENTGHTISGAIIPLVPGVAFTNGVRDLANGDYISGAVRLLDAILVFICIAIGVGVAVMLYQRLTGGAFL